MDKTQRMQLKCLICVLGLLLLFLLFVGRIVNMRQNAQQKEEINEPVPVPNVELLSNVWIMEEYEDGILLFCDGEERRYSFSQVWKSGQKYSGELEEQSDSLWHPGESVREQLADVELTDGTVTAIRVKKDKMNGRVIGATEEYIELDGAGTYPLSEEYRGYRLYETLEMGTVRDLCFGYDFADFVVDEGKICGILFTREETMKYIRVLIKGPDYESTLHNRVVVSADTDFTVRFGDGPDRTEQFFQKGEELTIDGDCEWFASGRIQIVPNALTGRILLKNVSRSQQTAGYRGSIELVSTESGIAVINEVLLEEYLYSVVPSEMPTSYPQEALKAQAICARTYAYGHMRRAGYPQYGAHVDDSTSYQVYNNIEEQASATKAVKETHGKLLYTARGELAGTYYYSTSCGVGSDAKVWKTKEAESIDYLHGKSINPNPDPGLGDLLCEEERFQEFIATRNYTDYEVSEPWYRWSYSVKKLDEEILTQKLQKRYQANEKLVLTLEKGAYVSKPVEELKAVTDLYIAKRGEGGYADELIIVTEEQTYKVISEHNIRSVLCDGASKVNRQDGSKVNCPSLLPSGFFILTAGKEGDNVVGYTLVGGGYGHGVGMSQNGARNMAFAGINAEDIITFFYEDCMLVDLYE